ncbi:hypothetical protein FS837_012371, partial [Tulasnella sp. UAMH 9824]
MDNALQSFATRSSEYVPLSPSSDGRIDLHQFGRTDYISYQGPSGARSGTPPFNPKTLNDTIFRAPLRVIQRRIEIKQATPLQEKPGRVKDTRAEEEWDKEMLKTRPHWAYRTTG